MIIILIIFLFINYSGVKADEPAFSAEERKRVISKIGNLLADNYVDAEIGETCRTYLYEESVSSKLIEYSHPRSFTRALNAEILKVHNDQHISVSFISPEEQRLDETQPAVSLLLQTPEKQSRNFGFERIEILTDNVGYLNLISFAPADLAGEVVKNTFDFIRYCDALIIDLRRNRGGSLDMVKQLAGYFFADSTYFSAYYRRRGDYIEKYWTAPDSVRKGFRDIPLFILTSKKTFSAAEDFAGGMQSRKRAILIGEQTGGGANPGFTFSVNRRFSIFIPTGRAINPITGGNWEQTGLTPDINTSAKNAINIAMEKAGFAARSRRKMLNDKHVDMYRKLVATLEIEATQVSNTDISVDSLLSLLLRDKMLDEWTINRLGYHYLSRKDYPTAEILLRFNADKYSESANANDSMAEYYYKTDQYNKAAEYYEKVLLIDSKQQNARFMLDKIYRKDK